MSSRYEREIDDILRRLGAKEARRRRRAEVTGRVNRYGRTVARAVGRVWLHGVYGQLLVAGFVLALLSLFLRAAAQPVAAFVAVLGVLLFLSPILIAFAARQYRRDTRWRGQTIEFRPRGLSGFRLLLWRWRNRRRW